jgi:hypothetical protein
MHHGALGRQQPAVTELTCSSFLSSATTLDVVFRLLCPTKIVLATRVAKSPSALPAVISTTCDTDWLHIHLQRRSCYLRHLWDRLVVDTKDLGCCITSGYAALYNLTTKPDRRLSCSKVWFCVAFQRSWFMIGSGLECNWNSLIGFRYVAIILTAKKLN